MDGTDYATDDSYDNNNVDMYGFIFVPWDNGQYSVHTNWARAENLIGFDQTSMNNFGAAQQAYQTAPSSTTYNAMMFASPRFQDHGDMDLMTVMVKAWGVGDGISDFLDDTTAFVSWAQSKTDPANGKAMLGSTNSETGNSWWIGANMPCPLTDDGRIGIEWNKGSKYWRSVTYGEDTMAGSKIAARGTAWEVYYNKPLTDVLTLNARYTHIEYDYTGSNAFFGADGAPVSIAQARAAGQNPVEEASNFRLAISYRY
jgi:hypothetical protein